MFSQSSPEFVGDEDLFTNPLLQELGYSNVPTSGHVGAGFDGLSSSVALNHSSPSNVANSTQHLNAAPSRSPPIPSLTFTSLEGAASSDPHLSTEDFSALGTSVPDLSIAAATSTFPSTMADSACGLSLSEVAMKNQANSQSPHQSVSLSVPMQHKHGSLDNVAHNMLSPSSCVSGDELAFFTPASSPSNSLLLSPAISPRGSFSSASRAPNPAIAPNGDRDNGTFYVDVKRLSNTNVEGAPQNSASLLGDVSHEQRPLFNDAAGLQFGGVPSSSLPLRSAASFSHNGSADLSAICHTPRSGSAPELQLDDVFTNVLSPSYTNGGGEQSAPGSTEDLRMNGSYLSTHSAFETRDHESAQYAYSQTPESELAYPPPWSPFINGPMCSPSVSSTSLHSPLATNMPNLSYDSINPPGYASSHQQTPTPPRIKIVPSSPSRFGKKGIDAPYATSEETSPQIQDYLLRRNSASYCSNYEVNAFSGGPYLGAGMYNDSIQPALLPNGGAVPVGSVDVRGLMRNVPTVSPASLPQNLPATIPSNVSFPSSDISNLNNYSVPASRTIPTTVLQVNNGTNAANGNSKSLLPPLSASQTLDHHATESANGKNSKPLSGYVCQIPGCGKRFTRAYNLKSHQNTHTNNRPYQCSVCKKAFARQHDKRRHEQLHTGIKAFACVTCNQKFARMDALNRHYRSETGKNCLKVAAEKERLQSIAAATAANAMNA
ncbi:calcineurin responsive transcription factor Prz1 [Schizosaccharomyces japonicus yFS275]|uniref:Calcineurin responsive transcription factor Prz1 n=1 Tax=Schizosaccharomyces japonicus (strain yFS275 / FY16936) TaxID=402676 RepID=B6K5A9_SCHJY|nr:calcineurin responsive transcription factor Prz1 [Schizosaccharomyces japonicus yFS275]EEB08713.1 calcineurin responsive transcription factor Prz1 [Schizosaccharomyces japonicus yFS275]